MKSTIFNILYIEPFERRILKRYPSILKSWNLYKWQDCIDSTLDILKELSPLVQDSYQYILFRMMSYSHYMLKNFDVSYDYALRILEACYEMKDNTQISRAYLDLARIHKMVEDVPIAIELLKKALQIDPNNIIAVSELCISHLEIREFELAKCNLQKIEELYHEQDIELNKTAINLINIYYNIQKEDYKVADKLLDEIEKDFFTPELTLASPLYFLLKGLVLFHNGEYEDSIVKLKNAIDQSKSYVRKNILINALELRADAYEKIGDYKSAYNDKYLYIQLSSELSNKLFNQRLSILKKYFYKKQNKIKNQQVIEKAVRLNTVSLMADNMIYEVTPHLHSMHLNVDSILFLNKRNPGVIQGLFLEEVKMIKESVIRTEQIIEQMKNYWNVSDNKTDQQIIDVNQTILKAKNIVLKHLDNDINININLSKDDLYISGNIILFEQILTNLLNNAIQALRQVNKPYKQIIVTTARCAGNYISIKVDDNAIGFLYENYPKEDDFLSTSKTSYDGMGLGLIIVKKFLDKFNGKIEFCNNELGGAGIELILPYK